MSKVTDYQTNIPKVRTRQYPVSYFMMQKMPIEERIGGLLDYGYSVSQIASMVKFSYEQVAQIMEDNGFKTIDKLDVYYES